MATNPFGNPKNLTTQKFLCCLHNQTYKTDLLLNGLMPIEVYNKISEGEVVGTEGQDKIRIIDQLVTGCEANGYIDRIGNTGKIRMTVAGIRLCNSIQEDGKSYCSKVPSYKD